MYSTLSIKTSKEKIQCVHPETLNTSEHNINNYTLVTGLMYSFLDLYEGVEFNILVQRNERKFAG